MNLRNVLLLDLVLGSLVCTLGRGSAPHCVLFLIVAIKMPTLAAHHPFFPVPHAFLLVGNGFITNGMTIHGGGRGLGGLRGGALGRALSIGLGAPIGLLGLEQASARILATRLPFDDVLDSTVMTELARVSASTGRAGTGLQLQVVDLLIQRVEVVSKLPLGDRNGISGDFLAASRSPMLCMA